MEQKLNSNSYAGAAADSDIQPIVIPPADIAVSPMLPAVFSSVDEAVKMLKLDRRRKWFEWEGIVVYNMWYTAPKSCTGCDGGGCQECRYTGNRKSCVPVPAFMPDGSIVKVCPSNGG